MAALRAMALVFLFPVSACNCRAQTTGVSDAVANDGGLDGVLETSQTDSGRRDTLPSGDTAHDALPDTPHGGYGPFVGVWDPIPGVDTCISMVANDPATAIPPLKWAACRSGRAGCQKLVVDWVEPSREHLGFGRPEPMKLIAGRLVLSYARDYFKGASFGSYAYQIGIVQPLDSGAIVAVGLDANYYESCAVGPAVGAYGRILAGAVVAPGTPGRELIGQAPWPAASDFTFSRWDDSAFGSTATQTFVVGANRFYIEARSPDSISLFDPATRTITIPSKPTRPAAELPIPVSGGAFAYDLTPPYGILYFRDDGTWSSVYKTVSPRVPSWIAVDHSDGDRLVWVEGTHFGSGYKESMLWTSPFATDSASVAPRRVGALVDANGRGGADLVANRGVVLNVSGDTTAMITRLSDGATWTINVEPGDGFVTPLWVDDTEAWISTADITLPSWTAYESGIVRIRRDTLGAPTAGK